MNKKILYVDMDNVLVNFQSGIDSLPDEIKNHHQKKWAQRNKIDENGKIKEDWDEIDGIFSLMMPIEDAIESYKILSEKFDTYILSTSPWENVSAASDKVAWVKKYLGKAAYKRLIISHHKNVNKGDFLMDDRKANGVDKFQGEHIHFATEKFPNWKVVTEYLLAKAE